MARAVSRRPLPAEAPMRSQVSPRRICAGHSGTVTLFFSQCLCFPCQYHSTNAPYSSSPTCSSYQTGKTGKGWEPCIKQCYFGTRGALDIKYSHFFSPLKGSSQLTASRKWRRGGTQIAQIAVRHVQRTCHISQAPISSQSTFHWTHLGKGTSRTRCIFLYLAVIKSSC